MVPLWGNWVHVWPLTILRKYGEKLCKKKLCSFEHKNDEVSVKGLEGNFDQIYKPFEMSSDGEKTAFNEIVDENIQDEEYFEL